jgi:ATP:corrinoid adenosyltransferase
MDQTLQDLAETIKESEYQELFPESDTQKVKNSREKIKEALFQVHHMIYDDELNEVLDDELSYNVPVSEVKEVLTGDDVVRFEKLVPEDKKVISKDRLREMTSTNAGR